MSRCPECHSSGTCREYCGSSKEDVVEGFEETVVDLEAELEKARSCIKEGIAAALLELENEPSKYTFVEWLERAVKTIEEIK